MSNWNGQKVRSARQHWGARLPLPCFLCGGAVLPQMTWVVEHIIPRALGGSVSDVSNQWVSHRSCSDASGSKVRAAKTETKRARIASEDQNLLELS